MTNWIRNNDHIHPDNNIGLKIYDKQLSDKCVLQIDKVVTAQHSDRASGMHINVTRKGGQSQNCFFLEYHVESDENDVFDIGMTSIAETNTSLKGGLLSQWLVTAGPKDSDVLCGFACTEINPVERRCDQGFKNRRGEGLNPSAAVVLVPENKINVCSSGETRGYNTSFGLAISRSNENPNYDCARTHVPICIEPGATAKDGVCILVHGSDPLIPEEDTPLLAGRYSSTFKKGLCFIDAIFEDDKVALQLAQNHKIKFGYSSYIGGLDDVSNGLMLGTDHLFWNSEDKSLYIEGNELWWRWKDSNNDWHYDKVAGY